MKLLERLEKADWLYSIGARVTAPVRELVEQIPDHAWQTLADYPSTGEAQISETRLGGAGWSGVASARSPPRASCFPTGSTSRL